MADTQKWSPLDEWNAREAREQAARLESGRPVRQRTPRAASGGDNPIARGTKILGLIAVVMIGLGAYGVYHASGLGREIVDGTVVELKEHTGTRPICMVNGFKTNGRRCLTPNATEPYGYATEVVEYAGPDGQPVRAEDPREQGGARDSVGDDVNVILHPDGSVEVAPKDSMLVSASLLAGGILLLAVVVVWERSRRRDP
ncbi:MAG TPA: hypothetical protein VF711_11490 [Acidimicrobiales bacterium]|jgi:hypothetical protein